MRVIEKDAKTEEDAINQILKEIGTENRDLIQNVEVIEGAKSILPFSSKKVKVKVTISESVEQETKQLVEEFIKQMGVNVNKINILEYDDNNVNIDLKTDKDSLIIGKRGKTLEALQYLVNIIFNKNREKRVKIILDVQGYRDKRVQSLQKLAKNLALKVKQTRRDKVLEPMNPYERKIIHSALQNNKDIKTESIGNGIFKKVKISLKK